MISWVRGTLTEISDEQVFLESGGLGYSVYVPSGILAELAQKKGEEVRLYTYHYLEGGIGGGPLRPVLFGFKNRVDLEFFKRITSVPKLGPKKAIKALSLPTRKIAEAIEDGDDGMLTTMPGIGKKLAQDIIHILQGKVAMFALMRDESAVAPQGEMDLRSEARDALEQLGYGISDAQRMIEKALQKEVKIKSAEELIRQIFMQRKKEDG